MSPPQLNVDVLAIICQFLTDASDVLSLALTSSSVRPIATRWLLRMDTISLTKETSIRKFHFFLFADAPARAPHVLALDIDISSGWPFYHQIRDEIANVPLLTDIITSCSHARQISIALQHTLDPLNPDIVNAIATLKTLRSLTVVGPVPNAVVLIREVTSPLRRIVVCSREVMNSYWYPAALEQCLARLAPSLEELEVYTFLADRDAIESHVHISTEPVFTMTQYHAVHSLSTPGFRGKPLVDHFHHLFPAVDTLRLGRLDKSVREDTYPHIRAANQRAQECSRVWKKLDLVVCDARMLYVLSLRCPIRLVMLDYGKEDGQRYAAEALRENPVPRLKITLGHGRHMFGGLFSPELGGKLTHLTLCMLHYNHIRAHSDSHRTAAPQLRWSDVLDKMVTTLRPLHRLTHLRIVLHANVYVYYDALSPFAPPEEYALALRGSTFNFEGTAASLVPLFPSLQHLFLTTCGVLNTWEDNSDPCAGRWKAYEQWHVPRAWRVQGAKPSALDRLEDGERILVALDDEVSASVILQEDLVLSESDEGAIRECIFRG